MTCVSVDRAIGMRLSLTEDRKESHSNNTTSLLTRDIDDFFGRVRRHLVTDDI